MAPTDVFTPPSATGRINRLVARVIQSRCHRLLSRWVVLVAYVGRQSGSEYCTPVQFAHMHHEFVIFVGNADAKKWWRNFIHADGLDIRILHRGEWCACRARAITATNDVDEATRLAQVYVDRFPRAEKIIDSALDASEAVFVQCVHAE